MKSVNTTEETKLITGQELIALGDIGPSELIDGRIVKMSPTGDEHGYVEFNIGAELKNFVRHHKNGWVLGGEVGIYIHRNPDHIRAADIVFISKEKLPKLTGSFLEAAPELVVEILSPYERWKDMEQKIRDYFSIGVEQIWIIEPAKKIITIHYSLDDIKEFYEKDTLNGQKSLKGFTLEVASIFAL